MTSPRPSPNIKADSTPNAETIRLLFANHPIPMWVYDLKTLAFLEVNDAALEKYGYTRAKADEEIERRLMEFDQKHSKPA